MWQLSHGQALRWRQWQDECVLFNALSGDTHLIGIGALRLLTLLQQAPASRATLGAALRQELALDEDAGFEAELDDLLAHLSSLYLIEPC